MRRRLPGLNLTPKLGNFGNKIGRGAIQTGRSRIERGGGQFGRENAGISSEREVRNFSVESLRFPGEGSSARGKSGPKPRPKGVGDGQQVQMNIPAPPHSSKQGHRRIVRPWGWKTAAGRRG